MPCPTERDRRELERLYDPTTLAFPTETTALTSTLEELCCRISDESRSIDPIAELEGLLNRYTADEINAVASTDDYPGAFLASMFAERRSLPGVRPYASILCQHKFLSRIAQRMHVPEATPHFVMVPADGDLPELPEASLRFVKPIKSFFSVGSHVVATEADILRARRDLPPATFFAPLDQMVRRYIPDAPSTRGMLIEELLIGSQVTLEGFASENEVVVMGVVDSVMFPGTRCFARFEYPSSLASQVQERMAEIACRFIAGIGYGTGCFNIEMMYDPAQDRIGIIEVNPRMSSQFADLFESVDGTNSYIVFHELARGRRPCWTKGSGMHPAAASCVLRRFEDAYVKRIPCADDIRRAAELCPGTRIEVHAREGYRLSDELQDGMSFRYGVVNIAGSSRCDIESRFTRIREELRFDLEPL